jgi:hypothetical protein
VLVEVDTSLIIVNFWHFKETETQWNIRKLVAAGISLLFQDKKRAETVDFRRAK